MARRKISLATTPHFIVIIRAIHERGQSQRDALDELNARGLWLTPDQRKAAGLE